MSKFIPCLTDQAYNLIIVLIRQRGLSPFDKHPNVDQSVILITGRTGGLCFQRLLTYVL
jgi:hypothetical protein